MSTWAKLVEQVIGSPEFAQIAKDTFVRKVKTPMSGRPGARLNDVLKAAHAEAQTMGFSGSLQDFKREVQQTVAAADGVPPEAYSFLQPAGRPAAPRAQIKGFTSGKTPEQQALFNRNEQKLRKAQDAEVELGAELRGGAFERELQGKALDPGVTTSEGQAKNIAKAQKDARVTAKAARPGTVKAAKELMKLDPELDPLSQAERGRGGQVMRLGDDEAMGAAGGFDDRALQAAAAGTSRDDFKAIEELLGRRPQTISPLEASSPLVDVGGPSAGQGRIVGMSKGGVAELDPGGASRFDVSHMRRFTPEQPQAAPSVDDMLQQLAPGSQGRYYERPLELGGEGLPGPRAAATSTESVPYRSDRLADEEWQKLLFGGGEPARLGPKPGDRPHPLAFAERPDYRALGDVAAEEARSLPPIQSLDAPVDEAMQQVIPGFEDTLGLGSVRPREANWDPNARAVVSQGQRADPRRGAGGYKARDTEFPLSRLQGMYGADAAQAKSRVGDVEAYAQQVLSNPLAPDDAKERVIQDALDAGLDMTVLRRLLTP